MKQILFRAISKEPESADQFIYGSLVNLSKPDKKPFYKIRDHNGKYSHIVQSSIGQYTGQVDKNGIPIFEGDIIQTGPIPEISVIIPPESKILGNIPQNLKL